jgi:hypothetical protein
MSKEIRIQAQRMSRVPEFAGAGQASWPYRQAVAAGVIEVDNTVSQRRLAVSHADMRAERTREMPITSDIGEIAMSGVLNSVSTNESAAQAEPPKEHIIGSKAIMGAIQNSRHGYDF